MDRIFIVVCGDVGRRVARHWREEGILVCALSRSSQAARHLKGLGIEPETGDLANFTASVA